VGPAAATEASVRRCG